MLFYTFEKYFKLKRYGTVGLVREAHNLKVDGSSPSIAHFFQNLFFDLFGNTTILLTIFFSFPLS